LRCGLRGFGMICGGAVARNERAGRASRKSCWARERGRDRMSNETHEQPRKSRGVLAPLVGVVAAGLVGWLWIRSGTRGDALFMFGPGGKVGGMVSLDGQLLFGATNVSLGPKRAWTAQTVSTPAQEMRELRAAGLDTPAIRQAAKFTAAARVGDAFGVKGAWCRVVGVPHWLVVGLCLVPGVRWGVRVGRRRRRVAGGRCPECGYDLRGVGGRCPECGSEVAGTSVPVA
jgi:hypothetical protein